MNKDLQNYISQARASGTDDSVIKQALLGAGWPASDVEEAFVSENPKSEIRNSNQYSNPNPQGTSKFHFPIKKLIKIFSVVLVIAVLIVGGYFVLANYFPQYAKFVQPYVGPVLDPVMEQIGLSMSSNQLPPSPSSNLSVPGDWKTATFDSLDEKYSFLVKVPPGWGAEDNVAELFYPVNVNDLLYFGKLRPTDSTKVESINIYVIPNEDRVSLINWYTSKGKYSNEDTEYTDTKAAVNNITINGLQALEVISPSKFLPSDKHRRIIVGKGNIIVELSIYASDGEMSLYDQIFSTFKFIESGNTATTPPPTAINTSAWKTYQSQFNYEVKYPQDWLLREITLGNINFLDFVNLSSFKNPNNNLEAYVAWWIGILKGDGIPRENLKINGIDMILVKFSSDKWPAMSGHPDCLGSDWWFFEKNGYIYRFMYLPGDRCIKPDDASKRDEAQKTMEAMVKTFQFKETTKVAPKVTVIEFNQLRVMVELAYDENRVFPDSLSQLKDIGSFKRENLQYVLYSASPDKQHYHMGIDLGDINFSDLAKDSDYNSKAQGWINGLDGKDPVYDSYSQ